jgi:hypothetical protein
MKNLPAKDIFVAFRSTDVLESSRMHTSREWKWMKAYILRAIYPRVESEVLLGWKGMLLEGFSWKKSG